MPWRKIAIWLVSVVGLGIVLNLIASILFEWRFPAFFGKIQDAILICWFWLATPVPIWLLLLSMVGVAYWCGAFPLPKLPARKPPHTDGNDIVAILKGFVGHYPGDISMVPISFSETDRKLNLAPGSTERFIETAAAYYKYRTSTKGKDVIVFEGGH
jgi:hypothetical protein